LEIINNLACGKPIATTLIEAIKSPIICGYCKPCYNTSMKPYIVRFKNERETSLDVVIHSEDCRDATQFAREYFGDHRIDYRNRNTVEYLCSDFEQNHTYHVTFPRS
jgi:hypothetical protein